VKSILQKIFWPILKVFETTEEPVNYKPSHRVILNIVGSLFVLLSLGSAAAALNSDQLGALVPVVVFFCIGFVSLLVGALGSDSAVAKIWGNK